MNSGGLAQLCVLVRGEESHQSAGLISGDAASLHHIKVGPGSVEVCIHVGREGVTGQIFVRVEDLLREARGGLLVEGEDAGRLAVDEVDVAVSANIIAVGLLLSVVGDDRAHEDVVRVGGVVGREDARVLGIIVVGGVPRLKRLTRDADGDR